MRLYRLRIYPSWTPGYAAEIDATPAHTSETHYRDLRDIRRDYILDPGAFLSPRRCPFLYILTSQAGGGGIVASAGSKRSQGNLGSNVSLFIFIVWAASLTSVQIFLAGLIIQLISFFIFSVIYLRFLFLVHKHERTAWLKDEGNGRWNDWRTLAFVLFLSCIGILVRASYYT